MTKTDKQQLHQVLAAIRGNRPETALRDTLYPVYVAVIVAGAYGVPAAQQLASSIDKKWLAENAWTPAGAVVGVAIAASLLILVRLVGGVRGPVVPPLPYLEFVVASPMPRKVTLGRHWRLSLGGSVIAGILVGALGGSGPVITNRAPPIVILPATVGGALFGLLGAEIWLQGQVHATPLGSRPSWLPHGRRNALALLDITGLKRQAATNFIIGGAVLVGDLRTARLDVVRPTTHARHIRLRPSGPLAVIARRDLLGLLRAPWSALSGLCLAVAGSAGLMLSLQSPHTPTVAPLVALVMSYLGFGAWCEGLRMHAANSGSPRLLGLAYRDTALAHLIVPTSAWALSAIAVGAGLSLAGLVRPTAIVWALGSAALLAGSHLMASFRGFAPIQVFSPGAGMPALILWYAMPLLATLTVGTATTAWAARAATPWVSFFCLLILTSGVATWGLALVNKQDRHS